MIRLKSLLLEDKKLRSVTVSSLGKLYHGTAFGDAIRREGFKVSASGFGQMGLAGVAMTPDDKTAQKYADSHARYSSGAGKPEVLVVKIDSGLNLADLQGMDHQIDVWEKLGKDPMKDDFDRKWVQGMNEKNHGFGITAQLKKLGFDGAVLDDTLGKGATEVCVFDPTKVRIVARKLGSEDFGPLPRGPVAHPAPFKAGPPSGDANFAG